MKKRWKNMKKKMEIDQNFIRELKEMNEKPNHERLIVSEPRVVIHLYPNSSNKVEIINIPGDNLTYKFPFIYIYTRGKLSGMFKETSVKYILVNEN